MRRRVGPEPERAPILHQPCVQRPVRCQAGLAIDAATEPFNGTAKATMKELVPSPVQRRLRNFNPPDMGRSEASRILAKVELGEDLALQRTRARAEMTISDPF